MNFIVLINPRPNFLESEMRIQIDGIHGLRAIDGYNRNSALLLKFNRHE